VKRTTLLSLLPALGFLLGACEKEVVGIRVPTGNEKLAVHCFISPQDEYITAFVSRTRGVYESKNPADTLVRDATVNLSDDVQTIRLLYDESHKAYLYGHRGHGSQAFASRRKRRTRSGLPRRRAKSLRQRVRYLWY
jgi:hypothetical protein